MAYKPLPIIEVAIDDLRLDLENYRIPTRSEDESAALKYLFASEDVIGTAKLILRDGYFDNEVPIVMRESSMPGYVVLEGNRRVSAIKALLNPGLVPRHEREIKDLLRKYETEARNIPTSIRVLVAPDRTTAAPHIARLHTTRPKRSWSRDQQATFYYSLLDRDTTVDDIKALYPGVDVKRFIRMAVVRRFLVAVHFQDPSLRGYVASDELTMSSFEYAYRNKDIAVAVGIDFDPDGFLKPSGYSPEHAARSLEAHRLESLEYLVSEFRAKRLNTRSPEFKKDSFAHSKLVERLQGQLPQSEDPTFAGDKAPADEATSRPSPDDQTSDDSVSVDPDDPPPAPTPRGPNHPDTKNTLSLAGVDYSLAPVGLQKRYIELRKIRIDILPSSSAMLLRSILEATIKLHFEGTPTPVSGQLSEVFKQVVASYRSHRPVKSTIDKISNGPVQTPGTIQWFNDMSHNADAVVNYADVRSAWELVNPLVRFLLQPAPPQGSS